MPTFDGATGWFLESGDDRPSRVLAGVLIAVALVALVVCLATDVLT